MNVDSEEGLALELEKSWEKYFGAPFKHVASKSTAGIEVSEWVFSVTEGHTGSTVLGDVGSYTVDTPLGVPALYMSGAFEASKGGHYDTFHDRRWCRSKQVDRANSPDVLLSGYGAARPADESMGEKKTIRANPAAAMGDGLSQGLALRHPCGIAGWWSSMRHATLYRNNTLALSGQGIGLGVGLPEGFGVGLGASARGTDTRTLESNALCRLRTQARVLVSWFLLPLYREVAASQAHRAADEREADESEDKGTDGAEAAVGAGTSTSVTVPLFMDLGHHVLFGLGGIVEVTFLSQRHPLKLTNGSIPPYSPPFSLCATINACPKTSKQCTAHRRKVRSSTCWARSMSPSSGFGATASKWHDRTSWSTSGHVMGMGCSCSAHGNMDPLFCSMSPYLMISGTFSTRSRSCCGCRMRWHFGGNSYVWIARRQLWKWRGPRTQRVSGRSRVT